MLGLRFSRLVHAALAGGGLTLTGCPGHGQDDDDESGTGTETETDSDDPTTAVSPTTDTPPPPPPPPPPPTDNIPPALVGIELLDGQILRLTFTEPIAPVDSVNPKRFRMSVARYHPDTYYGYTRTSYFDPGQFNHDQYCGEVCYDDYYYECYYQCYYGPPIELVVQDVLNDPNNPAQLELLLLQPIRPSLCQVADAFTQGGSVPGGLLLHYADGGAAQITDLAGLPLPASGKSWVIDKDSSYIYLDNVLFPEMNPLLPIPCVFF